MIRALLPLVLLLLPACRQSADDPRAVSAEEDAALNRAAARLEANATAEDTPAESPAR